MLKRILGLLFLCTVTTHAIANIHFNNFTQEEGLPDNKVWAITQDNNGFIWVGTGNGLAKFDGYKFTSYNLTDTNILSLPTNHIKSLYVDRSNDLWIGTMDTGLIHYSKGQFKTYKLPSEAPPKDILTIDGTNNLIWLGTDKGLYTINLLTGSVTQPTIQPLSTYQKSEPSKVNSIINNGVEVYVAFDSRILVFNLNSTFKKELKIRFPDTKLRIRKLIKESEQSFLIATNENLYRFDIKENLLETISDEIKGSVILDAIVTQDKILVSIFKKGLHLFSNKHDYYLNSEQNTNSLPHDVIITMFQSREGVIWLGTFDGLSKISPTLNKFKLISNHSEQPSCLKTNNIMSVNSLANEAMLISSTEQVILYSPRKNSCYQIKPPKESADSLYQYTVYESLEDSHDNIWLASSYGLVNINQLGEVKRSSTLGKANPRVYTLDFYGENQLLAGTTEGVFLVDKVTLNITPLDPSHPISNMAVNSIKTKDGNAYIGAQDGLYKYKGSKINKIQINSQIPIGRVTDIQLSGSSIFVASTRGVIYEISYEKETLINEHYIDAPNHTKSIQALEFSDKNILWASTLDGLYRLNLSTGEVNRYTQESGLQGDTFNIRASTKDGMGNIYFGGSKGITFFKPRNINIKYKEPSVVATKVNIFADKETQTGESNSYGPLSMVVPESLTLPHSANDFSIEFAGIHYVTPENIQYSYKLEGTHSNWITTESNNRQTTFSDLSPGNYEFKVKAKSDNTDWSSGDNILYLPITILPPIWLTWWAKTLYVLCFIIIILFYINLRTRRAVKQSKQLQVEVNQRTRQIAAQKSLIENLLEKKNELFANISHEFRTPLTLILGPIQKELDTLEQPKNHKNLQMIQRNANRLLIMVEQILKLAELKKESPTNKTVIDINKHLHDIAEMFKPLALRKDITINYHEFASCRSLIADDSLEVIVGNLLSNAIKYTPPGGAIEITLNQDDGNAVIAVSDDGVGIGQEQQELIFDRFVRLEQTSDISGTGIGLSIVKELVLSHGGNIQVESKPGVGSKFYIKIPVTELPAENHTQLKSRTISYLLNDELAIYKQQDVDNVFDPSDDRETLLIIDDNPDISDYLQSLLAPHYKCYTSPRGQQGVELALDIIPDLVLCDIMMPGIDGYEVADRLRSDSRTSHIPIILLTAKGDRLSRIKGWDNDIDDYMTKPFNEHELLLRIKNILSIRNILKEKASEIVGTDSLRMNSGLNEREQEFIKKLYDTFESCYKEESTTREKIASLMAVSERQLQRKVKGLVNKNPMDLFRDYRLEKAKDLLLTGKQINLISDLCGFSSASYFSQCFKAKFGITPKEFQK
ncbi:MAG TPA: ATP-binding protein [Kangiella sp.]